jgi:hypothetical protein
VMGFKVVHPNIYGAIFVILIADDEFLPTRKGAIPIRDQVVINFEDLKPYLMGRKFP